MTNVVTYLCCIYSKIGKIREYEGIKQVVHASPETFWAVKFKVLLSHFSTTIAVLSRHEKKKSLIKGFVSLSSETRARAERVHTKPWRPQGHEAEKRLCHKAAGSANLFSKSRK